MFRWLATNLRTFLLALALALVVWVLAVTSANPDQTQTYPKPIPIEFIGQNPSLVMTGTIPQQVQVALRAPQSIWTSLLSGEIPIHAIVDLTGVNAGTKTLQVQLQVATQPVRIVSITPPKFNLTLEKLVAVSMPVELSISGVPAIGYKTGDVSMDSAEVVVSGAQSLVDQIKHIRATLNVDNVRQSIDTSLPVVAVTGNGSTVAGISVLPNTIQVGLPVIQQGGYRDMAVKVMITGKLASGYRLENIIASPLTVTVFSENIPLIESLPGFVETTTLDLSGASSNIEAHLPLNLPAGVLLVGDQTVSVQIAIVPIEDSRPVAFRQVDVIGLTPGLKALLSPTTVDVILVGPLPILNALQPTDVKVQLDLSGLSLGTYQLKPVVIVPEGVTVQSILPGTVEVIIVKESTLILTPTIPALLTPTPTPTR